MLRTREQIIDFSRTPFLKLLVVVAGGILLFLIAVGFFIADLDRRMQAAQAEVPAAPVNGITKANFNRIETGMTYPEVVAILGQEGEEMRRSELVGYTIVMYGWKASSLGANMNAMFQNGKLVSKTQFGLK